MAKDLESKLQEVDEKIKQLQAQKQQFQTQMKENDRKERTRRLIQIGAIMDSVGIKTIPQAELLKKELQNKPELLQGITNKEDLFKENDTPINEKTQEKKHMEGPEIEEK